MANGELKGWVRFKKAMYYSMFQDQGNSLKKKNESVPEGVLDTSACYNMNFITQSFASWSADTGYMNYDDSVAIYSAGFSGNGLNASVMDPLARQTILNLPASFVTLPVPSPFTGYDTRITNLGFVDKVMPIDSDITLLAPGATVSVRLGNALAGGQTEKLRKTFVVDSSSAVFIYNYAAVLENPISNYHTPAERPSFTVRILDKNGNLIPSPCAVYTVYSGKDSSYISLRDTVWNDLFITLGAGGVDSTEYNYKNWTTVAIDLSTFIGQKITVEFTTRDCSLGGHFGYAYIQTMCSSFKISSNACLGVSDTLIAPVGFADYLWKDPAGNVIGKKPEVIITHPKLFGVYTVQLTSVGGCTSVLNTEVVPYQGPHVVAELAVNQNKADFSDAEFIFTDRSLNSLNCKLLFGDGDSSSECSVNHLYARPGIYDVKQIVTGDHGCLDTSSLEVKVLPVFWVPDAFTPNGDGLNDLFIPVMRGIANYHCCVFDRWGNLIFETYDLNAGWDGTFHNLKCQQDVYAYTITTSDFLGNSNKYVGHITLLK